MKKVKFDDGRFGIRKFSILRMRYVYGWGVDTIEYWVVINSRYFHSCLMSEAQVDKFIRLKNIKVTEVIGR